MEGVLLLTGVLLAWYWYSSAQAREQAVLVARRACERHGQLLLDETVLLERLRPRRGDDGRVRLRREYSFEFSGDGGERMRGTVVLFGGRVIAVNLALPSGRVFDLH